MVGLTALLGAIVGSWCGYLFSQSQPDGLGYLSMLTTVFLGIKFLFLPITGGDSQRKNLNSQKEIQKTILAMFLGILIGWVCGFTGSGGGILMLTVFTMVLGYNLKIAVGTSTMIMTAVALVGGVSHFVMGAEIFPLPMAIVVLTCLLGAWGSAKFANKCEIKKLNRVVGVVLLLLGIVTIAMKIWA